MADTLQNISVTAETWIEVYALTSITPGVPVSIQNTGVTDLYYSISAIEPPKNSDKYKIFRRGDTINLNSGDLSVWVFSPQVKGLINLSRFGFIASSSVPNDFFTEVGKGNVPGHSFVAIIGHNPNCSSTNFDDVWGGPGNMILPTVGEELEILSDSPDDTDGGDGARTVLITTLDVDLNPLPPAVVTMNGTTPVAVPGGAIHFRMHHLTPTSGGFVLTAGDVSVNPMESNIGNIHIRASGSSLIRSVIEAGEGKTEDAHVVPPAGFSIFGLRNLLAWPEGQSGDIVLTIKSRVPNSARISTGIVPIYQQPINIIFEAKNRGTSFLDRALRAKSTNEGASLTTITEYLMIDDNYL